MSHVYSVATGVLAEGGAADQLNLYEWSVDGGVRIVAMPVDPAVRSTERDSRGLQFRDARISADRTKLLFASQGRLTVEYGTIRSRCTCTTPLPTVSSACRARTAQRVGRDALSGRPRPRSEHPDAAGAVSVAAKPVGRRQTHVLRDGGRRRGSGSLGSSEERSSPEPRPSPTCEPSWRKPRAPGSRSAERSSELPRSPSLRAAGSMRRRRRYRLSRPRPRWPPRLPAPMINVSRRLGKGRHAMQRRGRGQERTDVAVGA